VSVRTFPDAAALAEALVVATEQAAARAIAARGRFVCALTGGSAPRLLYPALSKARLDWSKVHFFYGDERCVPATDPESNHGQALAVLGATGAVFHPIDGTLAPAAAALAYEQALLPLDVVHLGMGPDGHVCSLFPGHRLLGESQRLVSWLDDSPKPPPERVTLTLPALHSAGALWFLVLGEAKAGAVKAAQPGAVPASLLPAALAQRAARDSVWFLDQPAASLLTA
jgi:6-phosphogluconolactonase